MKQIQAVKFAERSIASKEAKVDSPKEPVAIRTREELSKFLSDLIDKDEPSSLASYVLNQDIL